MSTTKTAVYVCIRTIASKTPRLLFNARILTSNGVLPVPINDSLRAVMQAVEEVVPNPDYHFHEVHYYKDEHGFLRKHP
jgi:hypothetical protein